jgi:hypothetical protein
MRGDRFAVPLAADPVGAQRVEIDDEDVRTRGRRVAARQEERQREHHWPASQ